jgi:hypothetical protein
LDAAARPRFHIFPSVSREKDTADVEGVVCRRAGSFSAYAVMGTEKKAMLAFFWQLLADDTDEVQKSIHHRRGLMYVSRRLAGTAIRCWSQGKDRYVG